METTGELPILAVSALISVHLRIILAAGLAVSVCGANIRPDRQSSKGQLRNSPFGKETETQVVMLGNPHPQR